MSPHSSKAMTRHAWFIFSILTICYALVSFFRTSTSTLAVDIMREFAVGGGLMSVMSSAYFYPYGFMQIPAGILSDRWGSRNTIASFLLIGAAGALLPPDRRGRSRGSARRHSRAAAGQSRRRGGNFFMGHLPAGIFEGPGT